MRFSVLAAVTSVIMFGALLSCAPPQPEQPVEVDVSQVRQAIEGAVARWEQAVQNGDAAALGALYTSDAILLPPDSAMVRGNQGIQEFWGSVMQGGLKSADLTTVDLEVSGDAACEVGEAILSFEAEGGEPTTQPVKYIVFWKKDSDGSWKLHRDIWNSNPPPKEEQEQG